MSEDNKKKEQTTTEDSGSSNKDTSTNKKDKKEKQSKPKKEKQPINKKKLKYGSLATALTVIVVAIVVVINVIATNVTDRFDLTLDLTNDDIFTISQDTIDYLNDVQQDVQIIVLSDKSNFEDKAIYYKQASEVIQKYAKYSDKVTVEYINMNKNPNYVSKFKSIYSGDLTEGDIVVYRKGTGENDSDRIKVLTLNDLFTISYDDSGNGSVTQSKAEQELTSAVMYVTDANPKKAVLVSADMPNSVQYASYALKNMIESNGYDVEELDILTSDIDVDSTDLLVVFSPLNDFNSAVIDKISDYLYNDGKLGKNMLYVANYDQNTTTHIDEFLAEWGLKVGDNYIVETDSSSAQTVGVYGLNNYINSSIGVIANDDYSSLVSDTTLPIAVPVARPIELLWETNGDRETCTILNTSSTSALVPLDADNTFDISTAVTGIQNVMAMGSKYIFDDNNEKVTSNVMVMGSAFMTDVYITSDTSYNNGEFILNAINKMTGKSQGITIVPKSLVVSSVEISNLQYNVLKTILVIVVPLIVVVIGFIVFAKRRNK